MKRATAGTWDPTAGPVYFFAANMGASLTKSRQQPYVLVAVNELLHDNEDGSNESKLRNVLDAGNHVFLDSGVFWLTNQHKRAHGISMDEALGLHPADIDGFDVLFDRYVQLAKRYGDRVWGYIELDQGGRERKRETRKRLEDLGLAPIPVYHPLNDGPDYLDELMETYDRICFGNIVQANRHTRQRLLHMMWEAKVRHPGVWVHVLGLTPSQVSLAFPSDSADSSAWLTGLRWHAAERERAMLASMSAYPRDHAYQLGVTETQLMATDAAVASYNAIYRTWQGVLAERAELGAGPYDMGLLSLTFPITEEEISNVDQ